MTKRPRPAALDPALPSIDLHRHLDGNVRLETILDLARQHGVALPGDTLDALRPHAAHPMKRFLELGILATLNTDDPVVSGIDWPHEIEVAAPAAGLTPAEIRTAQRNALEIAFLTDEERRELLAVCAPPFSRRRSSGTA